MNTKYQHINHIRGPLKKAETTASAAADSVLDAASAISFIDASIVPGLEKLASACLEAAHAADDADFADKASHFHTERCLWKCPDGHYGDIYATDILLPSFVESLPKRLGTASQCLRDALWKLREPVENAISAAKVVADEFYAEAESMEKEKAEANGKAEDVAIEASNRPHCAEWLKPVLYRNSSNDKNARQTVSNRGLVARSRQWRISGETAQKAWNKAHADVCATEDVLNLAIDIAKNWYREWDTDV